MYLLLLHTFYVFRINVTRNLLLIIWDLLENRDWKSVQHGYDDLVIGASSEPAETTEKGFL